MEVKPIVKRVLDEYYQDHPYEYHSRVVMMDETGLIETTLKIVKERVEQLLREIEKERNRVIKLGDKYGWEGEQKAVWSYYLDKLKWFEKKIKKAFEGVIDG